MVIMWLITLAIPDIFIKIFNDDALLLEKGVPAVRLYYLAIL